MSSYVRKRRWRYTNGCDYDVIIKCDGCGRTEIAAEGQTDRLLVNGYVHENDWKTTKRNDKWINLCPDCKRANSIGENIKDKRLEEALVQFANHLKEILQKETLEKKKQEEEQARERYVERKRTQLVNTYRVLALIKGRDIGEGGKDNLCNNDKFIEVLAEYGYKIDDVDRWFIHWEVVYNRWCLVRKLSQAGLSVSEITKQMRWTYEKVKKATDERSERKFKDMLISHKNREDILSRAITGDTIFYNE